MHTITMPLFSVIIPLYNKRDYVSRAVESVFAQEFKDFELLVVDDGSTDGSPDIVSKYKDSRLRIIRQENMGGAGGQARNTGMQAAKGDWFAFLDADDIWLPNHLTELENIINYISQPALISTYPIEANEGTQVDVDQRRACRTREIEYFKEAAIKIGFNNCSSSAIHRDIFHTIGGFICVPSGPDLEYWARIALDFPVVLSERRTSVYYRGNMGNMEQLASTVAWADPGPISDLAKVSPSLAMIAERANDNPGLLGRDDVRAYVNSRLCNGIRVALRNSWPARARALRSLIIGPADFNIHFLASAMYMPRFLLRILNKGYGILRRPTG